MKFLSNIKGVAHKRRLVPFSASRCITTPMIGHNSVIILSTGWAKKVGLQTRDHNRFKTFFSLE